MLGSGSKFEALSAECSTLDGLNIHFGYLDEWHAHKTRTVYDVVETGTGKRDNSLLWVITTAGSNRAGICYEVRIFVTELLDGVFEDDTQFGIIYGLADGDDWTSEAALIKALVSVALVTQSTARPSSLAWRAVVTQLCSVRMPATIRRRMPRSWQSLAQPNQLGANRRQPGCARMCALAFPRVAGNTGSYIQSIGPR